MSHNRSHLDNPLLLPLRDETNIEDEIVAEHVKDIQVSLAMIANHADIENEVVIVTSATTYNILKDDHVIYADSSFNSVVLLLPNTSELEGKEYIIKYNNPSGAYQLDIYPTSALIEGGTKYTTTVHRKSVTLRAINGNWYITSEYL